MFFQAKVEFYEPPALTWIRKLDAEEKKRSEFVLIKLTNYHMVYVLSFENYINHVITPSDNTYMLIYLRLGLFGLYCILILIC